MPVDQAFKMASTNQKHSDQYSKRLCATFIEVGIPLFKLEHPALKCFLEDYTSRKTPSRTYLREVFLPEEYENEMKRMQNELSNSYIWVSIDETTDVMGRHIVVVLAGKLSKDKCGLSFLVLCDEIQQPDHRAI